MQYAEEFTRDIKKLVSDLVRRFPQDPIAARIHKRTVLAADMLPTCLIDEVGPVLYKYRKQIDAGDSSFFIKNEYDAELSNAVDKEKMGMAAYLIPMLKRAWSEQLNANEQQAYIAISQNLLDNYMEYLDQRRS